MQAFFKQIASFFLFFLLVFLLFFGTQTYIIRNKADFKFSKPYKYLVVGNSHPEVAYNDSLIANFKNIASSGEAYLYTYYKLKKVLEQNNEIETVFVEYTNLVVDSKMNDWSLGDKFMTKFYPKFGSFFTFNDTSLLFKNNPSSLINNFSILANENFMRILKNDYDFKNNIGGYKFLKNKDFQKKIATLTYEQIKNQQTGISKINIQYLQSIVQLCSDYNKNIYFIRTPQHRLMKLRNNEKIFVSIYNDKFSDIPFIDFNDYKLLDSDYRDTQHLNYKGAIKISKKLNTLLNTDSISQGFLKKNKIVIINE